MHYLTSDMPTRNNVPTLQMTTVKRVAWPDGINRKENEFLRSEPCAEQYCRDTIYRDYLSNNIDQLQKWMGIEKLKNLSNIAVNTWIQLSNYHESSLNDFKHLDIFLKLHPTEVLNFLQEGFYMMDDMDKEMFSRFVLVVPLRSKNGPVDAEAWTTIVEVLQSNETIRDIKELQILFDNSDNHRPNMATINQTEAVYDFDSSFEGFNNLAKLVIRGPHASNDLLHAIGIHCYRLKYLDINGSSATTEGVRLLFFKDLQSEMVYRKRFNSAMAWDMPKRLLRPLTKTLEYFDMSQLPSTDNILRSSILMACSQLTVTPSRFFFAPQGTLRFICKNIDNDPKLLPFRQNLLLHVRSKFCEDIFYFVRGLLACIQVNCPSFEVRVDDLGHEVAFLLKSNDCLIAYSELDKLTVINFTSFTRSSCLFIPIDLLGRFAPQIQRIKSPLKGVVSDKYPLNSLKHVSSPMIYKLETITSLVQKCPELHYLEVYELLFHPNPVNDKDISEMFEYECNNLKVFRLLFRNKISVLLGLKNILKSCPSIQMIGDLKCWGLPEKQFYRLHKQIYFHNFSIIMEYNGVLYKSDSFDSSCLEIVI